MTLKVEYKWARIIELEPAVLNRLSELPPWDGQERRVGERRAMPPSDGSARMLSLVLWIGLWVSTVVIAFGMGWLSK